MTEQPVRTVKVPADRPGYRPLPLALCDGDCGQQMEDDDEGWLLHFTDWTELVKVADIWGWTVDGDRTWCEEDKPDGVTGELPYAPPAGMDPLPGLEQTTASQAR